MLIIDWLLHRYIRKGERIRITGGGSNAASFETVKAIEGWGKYAAAMLEPVGAIRRDLIRRAAAGEWAYRYDD